jgi:hypothetical protein
VSDLTTYETGATRSADVKGVRYDLVPPEGVEAVAKAMHIGAVTHGANNWKKGLKNSILVNHAIRHIVEYLKEGNTTEDHIGHALANLMMLKWNEVNLPEFNDLNNIVEEFADELPPVKRKVGRPRKDETIQNKEGLDEI